jgi:hypothetical protein
MEYSWKMKGLARGVDPNTAEDELKRIRGKYGYLTADVIVKESESKKAILHNCFIWNNSEAAARYRIHQARILLNNIQVNVITDGEISKIEVYEIVSRKEGYRHIETFDFNDVQQIRLRVAREIEALQKKLSNYSEFARVVNYLNSAVDELNNFQEKSVIESVNY